MRRPPRQKHRQRGLKLRRQPPHGPRCQPAPHPPATVVTSDDCAGCAPNVVVNAWASCDGSAMISPKPTANRAASSVFAIVHYLSLGVAPTSKARSPSKCNGSGTRAEWSADAEPEIGESAAARTPNPLRTHLSHRDLRRARRRASPRPRGAPLVGRSPAARPHHVMRLASYRRAHILPREQSDQDENNHAQGNEQKKPRANPSDRQPPLHSVSLVPEGIVL